MSELSIALLLCNLLSGGDTEIRHEFPNLGKPRAVRVDCETPTHVIEVGLDGTDSARDSVHQAIFSSFLTAPEDPLARKTPLVIMIDRDGEEDRWEYEMRIVTRELGVPYGTCKAAFIEKWNAIGGQFPPPADYRQHCDLAGQFDPSVPPALADLGSDKPPLFGGEEDTTPAAME